MWVCDSGGKGRGAFWPILQSILPLREAILRSEMPSESGLASEAGAQGRRLPLLKEPSGSLRSCLWG